MDIKRDPVLWLALGIPVLMIVLVAAGILLPRFFVKPPQFNFVYSVVDNNSLPVYGEFYAYRVNDKGIVERYTASGGPEKTSPSAKPVDTRTLYLYDITTHTSKKITLEEVEKLSLDSAQVSPDGYAVETGNSDGAFPFGGDSGSDQYIVKGPYSERLGIAKTFGRSYYDWQFLGWVKK